MSSPLVSSVLSQEARARCLYILLVACFPAVVTGLLSFVVFATGIVKPDDGISHSSHFAHIDFPQPGDRVVEQFELRGSLRAVPSGETVYIVEAADGRTWPKVRLGNLPTDFSHQQHASAGAGFKYSIQLLSVKAAGERQIEKWFQSGLDTGKYPGLTNVKTSTVLARTRVIGQ